ncbi:MAG: hypothetical protein CSA20_00235 [Deltaproteobacteria bacterium]|nr:MAG: hypothetical protein CSA20_00235 [Deltaproteobacteria bacterium]
MFTLPAEKFFSLGKERKDFLEEILLFQRELLWRFLNIHLQIIFLKEMAIVSIILMKGKVM